MLASYSDMDHVQLLNYLMDMKKLILLLFLVPLIASAFDDYRIVTESMPIQGKECCWDVQITIFNGDEIISNSSTEYCCDDGIVIDEDHDLTATILGTYTDPDTEVIIFEVELRDHEGNTVVVKMTSKDEPDLGSLDSPAPSRTSLMAFGLDFLAPSPMAG